MKVKKKYISIRLTGAEAAESKLKFAAGEKKSCELNIETRTEWKGSSKECRKKREEKFVKSINNTHTKAFKLHPIRLIRYVWKQGSMFPLLALIPGVKRKKTPFACSR